MWCLQVAQFVQRTVQNQIFLLEKNPLHIFKSLCVCVWAMYITNDMIKGIQAMYSCQVSNVYSIKYS